MEYYSSLDASQLDAETPTLFELISAGQLEALLSPSLRYILVHYASKYPYYLIRLTNNFDEINLGLRSFIEWYFIKYWQGSFTENFYGIKRVTQTPLSDVKYNSAKLTQLVPSMIEDRRGLSGLQQAVSIFEVTGTAYISEKLNYSFEVWNAKFLTNQLIIDESNTPEENRKVRLKIAFVKVFPYVQSFFRAGNLIATLLYLSGQSKSPSLLTLLFRINYSRLNQYDYSKNEPKKVDREKRPTRVSPPTTLEYVLKLVTRNFTKPTWRGIKILMGTFFPVAIFTLKFLEWWNSSDFSLKLSKNQGNTLDFTLPPPSILEKYLKEIKTPEKPKKLYRSGNVCPLCKKELTNPAIIETGYVFDYMCIYNYLQTSHITISNKSEEEEEEEEEEDDSDEETEVAEKPEQSEKLEEPKTPKKSAIDINKGGRCPVTGKKLLGCKWNTIKNEWDIEGIRRLIF